MIMTIKSTDEIVTYPGASVATVQDLAKAREATAAPASKPSPADPGDPSNSGGLWRILQPPDLLPKDLTEQERSCLRSMGGIAGSTSDLRRRYLLRALGQVVAWCGDGGDDRTADLQQAIFRAKLSIGSGWLIDRAQESDLRIAKKVRRLGYRINQIGRRLLAYQAEVGRESDREGVEAKAAKIRTALRLAHEEGERLISEAQFERDLLATPKPTGGQEPAGGPTLKVRRRE